MKAVVLSLILCCAFEAVGLGQSSPLVGHWGFNIKPGQATWLGITEKSGKLEIWHQPTGGHVRPVTDFKASGAHLSLTLAEGAPGSPPVKWELDAKGDKLTGVQKIAE